MCELNQTFNPLKWEIFKEPYPIENGVLTIPDRPGYGVELIDDLEERFPFAPGRTTRRTGLRGREPADLGELRTCGASVVSFPY